jgi:hypothetical protein
MKDDPVRKMALAMQNLMQGQMQNRRPDCSGRRQVDVFVRTTISRRA